MNMMVETVARAICVARGQVPDAYSGHMIGNPERKSIFLDGAEAEAAAAILAMKPYIREAIEKVIQMDYDDAADVVREALYAR